MGSDTGWDLSASGDVVLFDALLTQISADACVNSERIFSTGHSFGGYISNALACYHGDKIRAIGEVAGGPSDWPFRNNIEVAAWLAHDPTDATVAISDGVKARDQHLERKGCAATTSAVLPEPCVSYNDSEEGHPVVWCEHDAGSSGGHGWPNFAGSAIWDFLRRNSTRAGVSSGGHVYGLQYYLPGKIAR